MGVFKEIEKADGSGVTTFYRLSDVHDTVETDDSEGTATVIDYNAAQNKPSVNGVALVGNKTSEDLGLQPAGDYITNDEADAKFIDEDELEAKNYVNETRLQEAIANIDHFHREIVNALPVTGQDNVLYMVRKQGSGEDIFNEYVWVGKTASETGYEFIGTTATDLTDYYQKDEVDDLLDGKVDKVDGKGLSEQNYTLSEKTKLASLENYDDTEIQAEVSGLNTDVNNLKSSNTNITNTLTELKPNVENNTAAVSTIYDLLDNKMTAIRLVEQGDGWVWMNLEGSRLTYAQASAALGHENCMLFIEQLENDGKVIPAEYKSEGDHINVIFKDLDSLVHIMTCGEDDAIVTEDVTTTDGQVDFTVEDEAIGYTTEMDAIYGDTSQQTLSGKNLFTTNYLILSGITVNDVTTNDFTYTDCWAREIVNNTNTVKILKPSTTYRISMKFKAIDRPSTFGSYNHNVLLGLYNGSDLMNIVQNDSKNTGTLNTWYTVSRWFTTPADLTNYRLLAYNYKGENNVTTGTIEIAYLQIEEGQTQTDFEPFTGSTSTGTAPSPNPDYPQSIRVVKGNNQVVSSNKNMLKVKQQDRTVSGVRITTNDDGSITVSGTSTGSLGINIADLDDSPIILKDGVAYTQSMVMIEGDGQFVVVPNVYNEDGSITYNYFSTDPSHLSDTKTSSTGSKKLRSYDFYINGANKTVNATFKIQLEENSLATDWVKYQGQTLPLSLGSIELCKIGNYQDKIYKQDDTWHLHKEIGKVTYNGSEEDWTKHATTGGDLYMIDIPDAVGYGYNTGNTAPAVCNSFIAKALGSFPDSAYGFFGITSGSQARFFVGEPNSHYGTLNAWKQYLSNNNLIIYYGLITSIDTEITDQTLLAQLNALEQITQYKHTYITIIGADLTPEADFTYIDNVVINNTDLILGKDTYWNDEVPTSADLPSNAQEGEIRIVQDTKNVYIYDGTNWIPFDKGGEIDLSNYLAKDNTTAWIPTSAFNPATKKYVDDSVGGVFVPTKTSQLTNDSNFIGKNSNDLTYYYTKSQTYTKSEVDALIHGGGGGGTGLNGTQLNADCAIDDLINNDTETFYYIGDNEIELTVPIASDSSHTITMTKDSFILIDRSGVYITLVTGGGGAYVFWKDTDSQNFYNGGYTLTEEDAYFKRDTYAKQEINAIIGSPRIWNWASTTNIGARADKSVASTIYTNYKTYSLFPTITLDASKYSDEYSGFYYFKSNTVESGAGEIIFSSSNEMDNTELYFTIANNLVSTVGLRPGNSVAGFIPFYDSGYYMTPTNWTVVGELPEYPNSTTLYFVSPDYYEQYINTSVSSTGFNSGVSFSHITNYFLNTNDLDDIKETWQNTAPSGASSGSESTRWLVHAPKYEVAVGATPVFTNTNSEDLHMYGVLEQRNPQTTALIYSAYLDVDANLVSGTMYYFDHDDYHGTGTGVPIPIYIPGSTSFYYTIGTNGGLACLKGDTPIKTSNTRTKQIKDLAVGDTVIDAKGNKTKVVKVFSHTVNTTFNITLSNEDVLVASYGHKFSINNHFRKACQVLKDHKLDRQDGSKFDVVATEIKQEEMEVYEILTESGTYTLGNGIICECEAI